MSSAERTQMISGRFITGEYNIYNTFICVSYLIPGPRDAHPYNTAVHERRAGSCVNTRDLTNC